MNKTIETKKFFTVFGIFKMLFNILFIIMIPLTIMAFITYYSNQSDENNLILIEGTISDIYTIEDEQYIIKLYGQKEEFYVNIALVKNMEFTMPVVEDKITIYTSADDLEEDYVRILKLKDSNNNLLIDYSTFLVNFSKHLFIVSIVVLIVSIIGNYIFKFLFKKQKSDNTDYVTHVIKSIPDESFIFFDPKFKLSYWRKEKKKAKLMYLLSTIIIIGLIIVIFKSIKDENDLDILIMLGLVFLLMFAGLYYFYSHTYNTKYFKKKRVKDFIEDYKVLIDEPNEERLKSLTDIFNEEGLIYLYADENNKEKQIVIPYQDLHLHACCYFNHSLYMARVYVCTDIIDKKYDDVPNDIVFIYNNSVRHIINQYNLDIPGLDYILDNFEEEINKHLKKEEIIDYKDK